MIDYNNTTDKYLNDHVDNLVDILDRIPLNQVTVLTGGNATGKSVIRKVMNARVADKLGIDGDKVVHKTAALSMQLRVSGSESLWGTGLDHISGDLPWMATSTHTWWLIDGLLKSHVDKKVDNDDSRCPSHHPFQDCCQISRPRQLHQHRRPDGRGMAEP